MAQKTKDFHGLSNTREYRIWNSMRQRCNNPSAKQYDSYGGRGIRVCERWNEFSAFIADMGFRPSRQLSLERIDNDGDYCPENCRWATKTQQQRNTRWCHLLTYNGKTRCVTEWAEVVGIHRNTIHHRLHLGWSTERALTAPLRR
jgi:hypothetical protein